MRGSGERPKLQWATDADPRCLAESGEEAARATKSAGHKVRVGAKCHNAALARDQRRVPPPRRSRLEQRARVDVDRPEDRVDGNKAIHAMAPGASGASDECRAPSRVDGHARKHAGLYDLDARIPGTIEQQRLEAGAVHVPPAR